MYIFIFEYENSENQMIFDQVDKKYMTKEEMGIKTAQLPNSRI